MCALDGNGKRLDQNDRPELNYGAYEFKLPSSYTTETPMFEPSYVFLLDVSL